MTDNPSPNSGTRVSSANRDRVRAILQGLDRRTTVFGDYADMFGDPAWAILLELYMAEAEQRKASVTGIAFSARAAPTTGQRHIASMCDRGLVERSADPRDRRRQFLSLTIQGRELLERWLAVS